MQNLSDLYIKKVLFDSFHDNCNSFTASSFSTKWFFKLLKNSSTLKSITEIVKFSPLLPWDISHRNRKLLQNIRFAVITNTLIATVIFRLLLRKWRNRNIAMKLSFIFLPCLWSVISILTITVRIPIRTIWCHKINPYIFFVIVWKIRKIVNNSKRDCHVTIPKHNTFT